MNSSQIVFADFKKGELPRGSIFRRRKMQISDEALLTGRSDEGLESWVATPRDANAKRGGFRFKAQAKSLEQVQMMKKVEQQMSARKPATPPPQPATVPSEGTDPWAKAKAARAAVFDAEAELADADLTQIQKIKLQRRVDRLRREADEAEAEAAAAEPKGPAADAPAAAAHAPDVMLAAGALVRMIGLVARADLNWCTARVLSYDEKISRYHVQVDGTWERVALKPTSIEAIDESEYGDEYGDEYANDEAVVGEANLSWAFSKDWACSKDVRAAPTPGAPTNTPEVQPARKIAWTVANDEDIHARADPVSMPGAFGGFACARTPKQSPGPRARGTKGPMRLATPYYPRTPLLTYTSTGGAEASPPPPAPITQPCVHPARSTLAEMARAAAGAAHALSAALGHTPNTAKLVETAAIAGAAAAFCLPAAPPAAPRTPAPSLAGLFGFRTAPAPNAADAIADAAEADRPDGGRRSALGELKANAFFASWRHEPGQGAPGDENSSSFVPIGPNRSMGAVTGAPFKGKGAVTGATKKGKASKDGEKPDEYEKPAKGGKDKGQHVSKELLSARKGEKRLKRGRNYKRNTVAV